MNLNTTLAISREYRKQILFLIFPFVLFLTYVSFFAIEKYRSTSTYVIRDLADSETLGMDLGIFGLGGSSKKLDAGIVVHYLQSMDMFQRIDQRFNLKAHYRSGQTDILERLIWAPSDEDFLEIYHKNLNIFPNASNGITTMTFESTDPQMARSILQYLLNAGEAFLNELNRKRVEKKVAFASSQLEANKAKLDAAIQVLEDFQNKHNMVDPSADMAVNNSIIANLETAIVQKTAEYNQLISYMSADTIDALKLKKEISELQSALKKTKSKLSGKDPARLNDLMFEFQKLKSDVEFAREVYKKTLVQYEVLRIDSLQEAKIFEVIATPTLPSRHVYPRRIYMTLVAVILILAGYKIFMLVGAVITDHKD
jgi:capsular polysaccharide transport system permease protein